MTAHDVISSFSPWEPGIFSLVLYAVMVFSLVGVLLFLCGWLGERKTNS